jgi:hypothetical protein
LKTARIEIAAIKSSYPKSSLSARDRSHTGLREERPTRARLKLTPPRGGRRVRGQGSDLPTITTAGIFPMKMHPRNEYTTDP